MITIARGETITIKVPVHEDGNIIFWEFATDAYDIGFGIYFKWEVDPDDEFANINGPGGPGGYHNDSHSLSGTGAGNPNHPNDEYSSHHSGDHHSNYSNRRSQSHSRQQEPVTEILPIFRRDSHSEVQCGSHQYPGNGVYLLKFDNSFSMWRSKTLYYKVYYTR